MAEQHAEQGEDRIEPGAERISMAAQLAQTVEGPSIEAPYADLASHLSDAYGIIDDLVIRHADPVGTGHSLLRHYIQEAGKLAEQLLHPEEQAADPGSEAPPAAG